MDESSAVAVPVTTKVAGGALFVRVGTAGLRGGSGSRRRRTSSEEEAQDCDGVGDHDTSVVVEVLRLPAVRVPTSAVRK